MITVDKNCLALNCEEGIYLYHKQCYLTGLGECGIEGSGLFVATYHMGFFRTFDCNSCLYQLKTETFDKLKFLFNLKTSAHNGAVFYDYDNT